MGQRSQVYVRIDKGSVRNEIIARYFQWNYGDRMISRAAHTVEWIEEHYKYIEYEKEKIYRIIDVNWDYRDVQVSADLLEEYEEYGKDYGTMNDYIFSCDNNDGYLFIDIDDEGVRWAISYDGKAMITPEEYMAFDRGEDYRDRLDAEQIKWLDDNIGYLKRVPTMTDDEVRILFHENKFENEIEPKCG